MKQTTCNKIKSLVNTKRHVYCTVIQKTTNRASVVALATQRVINLHINDMQGRTQGTEFSDITVLIDEDASHATLYIAEIEPDLPLHKLCDAFASFAAMRYGLDWACPGR